MSLSFFNLVNADVAMPTVTNVYFEKDGKPYDKPVSFTVNCYGYSWSPGPVIMKIPGTYTPEKVFSFSATCPKYGCKIYENYYLNYRHIDYCDLEGQADGKQFKIEKYSTNPISNCRENLEEWRKCELKFKIPSSAIPIPQPQPQTNKGFFKLVVESMMCFFKKLFGGTCLQPILF